MKLHRDAALSFNARRQLAERVVEQGWTLTAAAATVGVSVRRARKWVARYKLAGEAGFVDRSSAPRRVANRTSCDWIEVVTKLRGRRMTAAEIAETLGDAGLNGLGDLDQVRDRSTRPARARAARPL